MPFEALAKKGKDGVYTKDWVWTSHMDPHSLPNPMATSLPEHTLHYVYLLISESDPTRNYTGISENIEQRLIDHNAGKNKHSIMYRPWKLVTYLAFTDPDKARAFERYLKTASGIAFANKRLR